MTDLTNAIDALQADKQLAHEEASYASVQEQIKTAEESLRASAEAVRQYREHISTTKAEIRRLKARKRVFAHAKFKLEQINEEFGE